MQYSRAAEAESEGCGVLDTSHARGMTAVCVALFENRIVEMDCVPVRNTSILQITQTFVD